MKRVAVLDPGRGKCGLVLADQVHDFGRGVPSAIAGPGGRAGLTQDANIRVGPGRRGEDAVLSVNRTAAERTGGVWDYVSPSRLNLWLRCPLAFRLQYIDGIVPPVSRSLFLGRIVHAGLEWFYRHRQLGVVVPK